jgi:hypothetical protein
VARLRASAGEPATVLARRCAPASWLPASREPLPDLRREGLTRRPPELAPWQTTCRTPPVDFCNRHGFRARPRIVRNPARLAGSHPPAGRVCGQPAPCGARLAGTSRVRGRRGRSHASTIHARGVGGFYPEPLGPGHLLSRARAPAGWSSRTGMEPKLPRAAGGRRTRRLPREGCARPTPRERDPPPHTRGAFDRWAGRRPGPYSTGCRQPGENRHDALFISAISFGFRLAVGLR